MTPPPSHLSCGDSLDPWRSVRGRAADVHARVADFIRTFSHGAAPSGVYLTIGGGPSAARETARARWGTPAQESGWEAEWKAGDDQPLHPRWPELVQFVIDESSPEVVLRLSYRFELRADDPAWPRTPRLESRISVSLAQVCGWRVELRFPFAETGADFDAYRARVEAALGITIADKELVLSVWRKENTGWLRRKLPDPARAAARKQAQAVPLERFIAYISPSDGESLRCRTLAETHARCEALYAACAARGGVVGASLHVCARHATDASDRARLEAIREDAVARFGERLDRISHPAVLAFLDEHADLVGARPSEPLSAYLTWRFHLAGFKSRSAGETVMRLAVGTRLRWSMIARFPVTDPDDATLRAIDDAITAALGRPLPARNFRLVTTRGGSFTSRRALPGWR